MPNKNNDGLIEEQRRKQQELVELKKLKQQFENDVDGFVAEGGTVAAPLTGTKRIKNFFHYAKGAIVFCILVGIILAVGITQCATRTRYDCTVVLYMKHSVNSTMVENIATIMEQYCEDTNGDGEVNVLVMDCAVSDEEAMTEWGRSKKTRLMAQFASEEAIVYIADKEALEELMGLDEESFVSNSLKLPAYDGKAFPLNGTVFDTAFDVVIDGHSKEFEYYLLRRNVTGTAIEGKSDVRKYSEQADRLIKSIVESPYLSDDKMPQLEKIEAE